MTPQEMLDRIKDALSSNIPPYPCVDEQTEEALALIPQLRAALPQWRPISEAPKDYTQILIKTNSLDYSVVRHDVDDPMPVGIVPSGHRFVVDDGKHGPFPIRGDYPEYFITLDFLPPLPPALEVSHDQ